VFNARPSSILEENRVSYCRALTGKPHFSALYGIYIVTLNELKAVLKVSTLADQTRALKSTGLQTTGENGFTEIRRRNQHSIDETTQTSKEVAVLAKTSAALNTPLPKYVITQKFFAALQTADMEPDTSVQRPCHMRRQFLKTGGPTPNNLHLCN
jgi:hypothetical protein